VDHNTGQINWPTALQHADFAAFRVELERAFAARAEVGGTDELTNAKAQEAARGMRDELKTHLRMLSPKDYITARRFIDSLAHEIQQPAG
jgi:hypothetical protein